MLIVKRNKSVLAAFLILAMAFMYGVFPVVPQATAAGMTEVSDTISDSSPSSYAEHTISFKLTTPLEATDYVRITFEEDTGTPANGFTEVSNLNHGSETVCPAGWSNASSSGNMIDCAATGAVATTTAVVITTKNIKNPTPSKAYTVTIETYTAAGALIDESEVKVYIIDSVSVTARVPATLAFTIDAVAPAAVINTATTSIESTATLIPFGTLAPDTRVSIAQNLKVSTNAADGFSVTVQQDGNLTSAAGAEISPYSLAGYAAWASPEPVLDTPATYGHLGVTSDDTGLGFDGGLFSGLSTTPLEVMSHGGPVNGETIGAGETNVAYSLEISAMQAAGDYSAVLTYICTPNY